MRRQQNAKLVELVVQLREMHHRGLRVHNVDAADDGPGVGIAEAAVRISANAGGKGEIRRPQWRAVAPSQTRPEVESHGHPLAAAGQILQSRAAIRDRGHFGAQQTDQLTVRVERGDRAVRELQHVDLDYFRIDRRVQRGGKGGDADGEIRVWRGRSSASQQKPHQHRRADQPGCQFSAQ